MAALTTYRDDRTVSSSRPRSTIIALFALLPILAACGQDEPASDEARTADLPQPTFPTLTDTMVAAGAGNDWPTHGGNLANHRHSPLQQVHRDNVAQLVPAWIHSTGIEGAFETTPLVVGNTLYATTAGGRVLALNAATGEEQWSYDPRPATVTLCCGPRSRGVSAYGDLVYVASLDARLLALNARSGELVWERQLADPAAGYSATMAPLAVGGRVFMGVSGEQYGIRGFLAAFDARSGEELWRWHSIRSPDRGGWWGEWAENDPFGTPLNRDVPGERADSADRAGSWAVGGGGIATTPAYDIDTGVLYVNVEAPAPLAWGGVRPGDNLYTGSIVALDSRTGEMAWHTQYLPHDVWGLSGGSPPFLFDRGGQRYVGFAGRTGWVYVFEAGTGRPVLRSDNFVPQESMFRRPAGAGEGVAEGMREAVRVAPGANGGNAGTGVAYDPETGTVYVGGVHQPMVYTSRAEGYAQGALWLGGTVQFPPGEEQWGTVTAIDLGTGEIRWQRRTPRPVHSDVLVTDGGLVFVGQGTGSLDAFDAATGDLLWQFRTSAGVHGGPVTYAAGGVQYVVVPAGGSFHFDTPPGDDLIAFALASERPGAYVTAYDTPSYERSGPAVAGAGGVRQVDRETGEPLPERGPAPDTTGAMDPDTGAIPPDTAATPADTGSGDGDRGPTGGVDGTTGGR